MKSLVTVSKNGSGLISLDEMKTWLRVTSTDEDALISATTAGAISYAENYLNRAIGQNSYIMNLDAFEDVIYLFRPPVIEVTSIVYTMTDGTEGIVDVADTVLDPDSGRLAPAFGEVWPTAANTIAAVRISYDSDGMFAENEGQDILNAIKLIVTYRYDYRDDPNQRWRKASDSILQPLRIHNF
jgi:uncharacterized phiE125 gp8 family phage protein